MAEEELLKQITELRDELKRLEEYKLNIRQRISELKSLKSKYLETIKAYRDKIEEIRKAIKDLEVKRNEVIIKRRELISKLRDIKNEFFTKRREFSELSSFSKVSIDSLRKKIDSMEWRIITESLPIQEENKIIKEIGRLEGMLSKALEAKKLSGELLDLRAQISSLTIELNELNNFFDKLTSEINARREEIRNINKSRDEIKRKLSEVSEEIRNLVQSLINTASKINELRERYASLNQKLKEVRIAKTKATEEKIIEEKKKLVEEKRRRGERLTFEDLRILYGEYHEQL